MAQVKYKKKFGKKKKGQTQRLALSLSRRLEQNGIVEIISTDNILKPKQ